MAELHVAEFSKWGIVVASVSYAVLWASAKAVGRKWQLATLVPDKSTLPRVSVVIAARNEARNLGLCLESILSQDSVEQVIVVNDHSSDETVAVATRIAAQEPRLMVLSSPELPAEWTGKSFALQTGAQTATAPLILFSDADVLLAPGIVQQAASTMDQANLDHLSGHFHVVCKTLAERICAPLLVLSSSLALFGTAHKLGAATGAFNMVRMESYWRHGGHTAIKGEMVDDVALARHLHRRGARSRFVLTGDQVKVRLFEGWCGFIEAVSRSSVPFLKLGGFAACGAALLFATLMLWTVFCFFLPVIGESLQIVHDAVGANAIYWFGPLPYLLGVLAVGAAAPFTDASRFYSFLYPIAGLIMGYAVFKAGLNQLRGQPVIWRGRAYPVS